MSGLRGDLSKLRGIERSFRELPRVVGAKVATAVAGELTDLMRRTFNASENAYGDPWAYGKEGQRVTMRKSGALAADVGFVAIGTRLRGKLGPRYAKYQVGPRPVFPRKKLPVAWVAAIQAAASKVIRAELEGGA